MDRLAVIDLGSASTTLAVFEGGRRGFLDRVHTEGESSRLLKRLDEGRRLPPEAVAELVEHVAAYRDVAREQGATRIQVAATSAMRDAVNGPEVLAELARIEGLEVRLISGAEEGRLAAHTVLCTLPFRDGVVVDQGGGSMQLVRVKARRIRAVVSLPLGALRLSERFLPDPGVPSAAALSALRRHVVETLGTVPWLSEAGGQLVGVGGGARALGKITRRAGNGDFRHGHGYLLDAEALLDRYEQLSRMDAATRADVPGVPGSRIDTIVAAALTLSTLVRLGHFDGLHLSTYGLREGIAFRALYGDAPVPDPGAAGIRGRLKVAPPERGPAVTGLSPCERRLYAAATKLAPERLLDKPIQGFWQEEVGRVVDALRRPR